MKFLTAVRSLDRYGWAMLAALLLGVPVVLLTFIVLAAHITFWGALLVFFLVPSALVKGLEDWERYRRTRRELGQ